MPLPVTPTDGRIEGVVLAPDGTPLGGAMVVAKGLGGLVDKLWLQTRSAEDGSFSLAVPFGRYHLGAVAGNPGWIAPVERLVEVPEGGVSPDHTLQFRIPDATLSGTLTVDNASAGGEVYVWAWSEDGGFVHGRFPVEPSGGMQRLELPASGPYTLAVISGVTWHLGAAFETESEFWSGQAEVDVQGSNVAFDLTLDGPYPKPAPVAVTFDASESQQISLADGTSIYIPAGAMPVQGLVTLRIVPVARLPHQPHANILRYGYAFLATDANGQPIEAHFNQDVTITFSYDEVELFERHIVEYWLKPAYYSTTDEQWVFPESFVVDTEANQVAMQIDHFTDFALTGVEGYAIYLPQISR